MLHVAPGGQTDFNFPRGGVPAIAIKVTDFVGPGESKLEAGTHVNHTDVGGFRPPCLGRRRPRWPDDGRLQGLGDVGIGRDATENLRHPSGLNRPAPPSTGRGPPRTCGDRRPTGSVGPMGHELSLLEGLATTRAIRRYRDEPIPDDDLSTILFSATRAPTGSNRQGFRFVVLRDGPRAVEAKALLGRTFRDGWDRKRREDGYEEGSGADDGSPKARMARAMQHFVDHFERTPVVILACVRARHDGIQDGASVYPACQNILLAARALGHGGVLTGWHRLVEDELRDLLEIPDDFRLAATIPLGRPVGGHGPVRRRPLAELVFDDRWGEPAPWAVDPPDARFTQAGPPP